MDPLGGMSQETFASLTTGGELMMLMGAPAIPRDMTTETMWSAKASTGEHRQPHSFGGALLCAGRAGPKNSGNHTHGMQLVI